MTITIDIIERGQMPVNDKGETLRFLKTALPTTPRTRASDRRLHGRELFSQEMEIAQLGNFRP